MSQSMTFGVIETPTQTAGTGIYRSLPWASVRHRAGIAMYPTKAGTDEPLDQSSRSSALWNPGAVEVVPAE